MVNQQTLQGNWNEIKGRIRNRWGQISDDELEQAHGNVDMLVGTIQRKTGTAREDVERYLDQLASEGDVDQDTAETARKYAKAMADQLDAATERAREAASEGFEHTQAVVRERPMESLATCFGVGMITGVVVGLLLRSR